MFLLDDLLLVPAHGFVFLLRQIQEAAEKELDSESAIKQQLLALEMEREAGRIDPDEWSEREAELLARLRAVRQHHARPPQALHTGDASITIETPGLPANGEAGRGDGGA